MAFPNGCMPGPRRATNLLTSLSRRIRDQTRSRPICPSPLHIVFSAGHYSRNPV
jgi:hypothetical protein